MREPILLLVSMVPTLSSYSLMEQFMRVGWVFSSLLCKNDVLVIMQGCTRISEWYVWTELID